jgi:hypothetical protein
MNGERERENEALWHNKKREKKIKRIFCSSKDT